MTKSLEELLIADHAKRLELDVLASMNRSDYWMGKSGPVLIETMDFHHLENIVNLFSQEGMVVSPLWQESFEKVMLTYLRKQAEINEVHKDIL
jgi:hypothetical protein